MRKGASFLIFITGAFGSLMGAIIFFGEPTLISVYERVVTNERMIGFFSFILILHVSGWGLLILSYLKKKKED